MHRGHHGEEELHNEIHISEVDTPAAAVRRSGSRVGTARLKIFLCVVAVCFILGIIIAVCCKKSTVVSWWVGTTFSAVLGSITLLLKHGKDFNRFIHIRSLFWYVYNHIFLWILFTVVCSSVSLGAAPACRLVEEGVTEPGKDKPVDPPKKEEPEKEPARNSIPFIWEKDPIIEKLDRYFDMEIPEGEEIKYIEMLISEDLATIEVGISYTKEELNTSEYGEHIKEAENRHSIYEFCCMKDICKDVQKRSLEEEMLERVQANAVYSTALNHQNMGNLNSLLKGYAENDKEELLDLEIKALKEYIAGMKCAVKEENDSLESQLWTEIENKYIEIEQLTDSGEKKYANVSFLSQISPSLFYKK